MIRCMMCGADPATQPTAVHRLNNKGQMGVWACEAHYAEEKARYFHDTILTRLLRCQRGGTTAPSAPGQVASLRSSQR